ncbi:isochorismatase family protein [Winogradskya humida]|uniref:Phenazine biosynthesis protein PhzD n=1 Tax=Winogradskya humida TaxID=113566 RepID=A0ABQ3ZX51_9ACTN|nr:isochorismatase family protein [Actinoplanes humidus]GIE23192.1 phenazine biosynthesis protein PhzD [Actinoplanes humidus]
MTGIPSTTAYPMPDTLPPARVPWRLRPERAVLLLHDMQYYFLRPFSPTAAPGAALMRNCVSLRDRCAAHGIPVAYTAQPGDMNDEDRGLLKDFWGVGMTAGPADREVAGELAPAPGDWTFTKWRYSAFHRSDLLDRMRRAGRDQLIVAGVYASTGILATALDAFAHDIQVFLAADAVADFDEAHHRLALDLAAERCARVLTTDDLLLEVTG